MNLSYGFGFLLDAFGKVLTLLGGVFTWMSGLFRYLRDHIFLGILGACGVVAYVYGYVIAKLNAGLGSIQDVLHSPPGVTDINTGWQYFIGVLDNVNIILPVPIILTSILTLIGFRAVWALYKFLKSWIPTVSGS